MNGSFGNSLLSAVRWTVLGVLGLVSPLVADAATYRFDKIIGANDPRFRSFQYNGTPTVNNAGVVIFGAIDSDGRQGLYASHNGVISTLIDTSSELASFRFEEVSVNSSGVVAFLGTLDTGEEGVFTIDNGAMTPIATTSAQFNSFGGASINDAGTVAFWGSSSESGVAGIYAGNGGPLTTIANTTTFIDGGGVERKRGPTQRQQPSINNHGDVAYFASYVGGNGVFVHRDGVDQRIADNEGPLSTFDVNARASINDHGAVAFNSYTESPTGGTFKGVYLYEEGVLTLIADNRNIPLTYRHFSDLTDVTLNNEGVLSFGGLFDAYPADDGVIPGVYVGSEEGIQNITLQLPGSPSHGLRETYVWGQSLNDRGQVVFYTLFGGPAIYLATPIPEPSAMLLTVLALAGTAATRRG